jgi:aminoglycoside 6'-N-acetyltransferase
MTDGTRPETAIRTPPRVLAGQIGIRPLTRADLPILLGWFNDPLIRNWWPREPPTPGGIEDKYGPRIDGTVPVHVFIYTCSGVPAGMMQCFRWAQRPSRKFPVAVPAAATIDFLLGEARFRSQGVGTAAFAKSVGHVLDLFPDVGYLMGYPHRDNHAFQRVLTNAGYRRLADAADDLALPRPLPDDPNILYVRPRAGFARPGLS